MATQTETTILRLTDQVSKPAKAAEGQLSRLEKQILKTQTAAAKLSGSLGDITKVANKLPGNSVVERFAGALGKMLGRGKQAEVKVAAPRAPRAPKTPAAPKEPRAPRAEAAVRKTGAAAKDAEKSLTGFGAALAKLGPYASAAVGALVVMAGYLTILSGGFVKAFLSSEEFRRELSDLRSMFASFPRYAGGTVVWAEQLQKQLTKVSQTSALSRDKLKDYANQLIQARFRGEALNTALEGMSIAGSVSDAVAKRFMYQAQMARLNGQSVGKLVEQYKKLWGPLVKEKALALDRQMQLLRSNITELFSGADFRPLLRVLQTVLGVFDPTTKSGERLKKTITKLAEAAQIAILKFVIAALRLYIAVHKNEVQWKGLKTVGQGIVIMLKVLGVAMVAAGALVAFHVAKIALAFATLGAVVATFVNFWRKHWDSAVSVASKAWELIKSGASAVVTWFAEFLWGDTGKDVVEGIAQGISKAGDKVWEALKSVMGGAITKVRKLLDSHSPSRVFDRQVGITIPQGAAKGIDKGRPLVERSAARMSASIQSEGLNLPNLSESFTLPKFDASPRTSAVAPSAAPVASPSKAVNVSLTNCTFGSGITKDMVQAWFVEAVEEEMLRGN